MCVHCLYEKVSNFAMLEMSTRLALHPSIITDPAKALKECFVAINSALSDMGETPLYRLDYTQVHTIYTSDAHPNSSN
jgi:hypothetical protein